MVNISKKDTKEERHVLALTVDNEAGVLARVVGLFSGRGYNIHSLTVSEIDPEHHLSRITVTIFAPKHVIKHIVTLLERLIPVHKVRDLVEEGSFVEKGLVLLKVKAKGDKRTEVLRISDEFDAKEVDSTDKSFVFQLTDIPSKLDEFIELMRPYGIIEYVRTGTAAMARGSEEF
jgi:acetolactate synthase-1/3 small subunit